MPIATHDQRGKIQGVVGAVVGLDNVLVGSQRRFDELRLFQN
jgi:hypothetical protein